MRNVRCFMVDEDTAVDYDFNDPESLAQLALLKAQQVLGKFVEVAGILGRLVGMPNSSSTARSSGHPPLPMCTLSPPTKLAAPWVACCTWARATSK